MYLIMLFKETPKTPAIQEYLQIRDNSRFKKIESKT